MKILKVLILGLFLLTTILIFILVGLSLITVFHIRRNDNDIPHNEFKLHQYYQLNANTNKVGVGFTTLDHQLRDEEFLYIEDELENHMLISNFESDGKRYKCTGKCFCEDFNQKRRTTLPLVKKGMMYLVVAISSVLAVELSKKYFEEECTTHLKESDCPEHFIRSEVEECENIDDDKSPANIQSEESEYEVRMNDYICSANCLTRNVFSEVAGEVSDTFDVEADTGRGTTFIQEIDTLQKRVDLYQCEERRFDGIVTLMNVGVTSEMDEKILAQKAFISGKLNEFCSEMSVLKLKVGDKELPYPACVSHRGNLNPTIHCIKGFHGYG